MAGLSVQALVVTEIADAAVTLTDDATGDAAAAVAGKTKPY